MPETSTVTVKLRVNVSPFIRATHDMGISMRNMAADVAGKPRPPRKPYPKRHSGMTARQYRSARRAYNRECRAYKQALRTWSQPSFAERWSAAAPLFRAAERAKESQ